VHAASSPVARQLAVSWSARKTFVSSNKTRQLDAH